MCFIPEIDCVKQELQSINTQVIRESDKRVYETTNVKFVGLGEPASFNLTFTCGGFSTWISQRFRSILCDIKINGNYNYIKCNNLDIKALYDDILSLLHLQYYATSQYFIVLSEFSSNGDGCNIMSKEKYRDTTQGQNNNSIRLYLPNYIGSCLIQKLILSANNRQYSLTIQSLSKFYRQPNYQTTALNQPQDLFTYMHDISNTTSQLIMILPEDELKRLRKLKEEYNNLIQNNKCQGDKQ